LTLPGSESLLTISLKKNHLKVFFFSRKRREKYCWPKRNKNLLGRAGTESREKLPPRNWGSSCTWTEQGKQCPRVNFIPAGEEGRKHVAAVDYFAMMFIKEESVGS